MSAADQNPFDWFPEDREDISNAAKLSPGQYGFVREPLAKKIAERHGLTRSYPLELLDKEVQALRNGNRASDGKQGTPLAFEDPEPWPEPVDVAALLERMAEWLRSFVVMPKEAADACALWAVTTWFVDCVDWAALLLLTSPEKGCAKTRLLNRLRCLVRRPYRTSGVGATPAVIFRLNTESQPTFLVDQAEKLRSNDDSKDIVTLFADGFERGGMVARCTKGPNGNQIVEHFDAFGFRALALVGYLVDILMDRSIVIRLQRKRKSDKVRRAPGRVWKAEGAEFARQTARWAADNALRVTAAAESAPRPEWLDDRDADLWGPLFGIASAARGAWPERALQAARLLSAGDYPEDQTAGVALLNFLRRVLPEGEDRIETAEIIRLARDDDEAPTGYGGHDLTSRDVARLLKPFGIKPRKIRFGDRTAQGYRLEDLQDAFDRYLAPPSSPDGDPGTEHPEQRLNHATSGRSEKRNTTPSVPDRKQAVSRCATTDVPDVPDGEGGLGLEAGPEPIPEEPWTDDDRGEIDEPEPESATAPAALLVELSEDARACVEYVRAHGKCSPYDAWEDLPVFLGRGRSEVQAVFEWLLERGIFEASGSAAAPRYDLAEGATV
ncbi:MAG: DUF3631 domain-containing protein [Gemmatimonadota bacterium]